MTDHAVNEAKVNMTADGSDSKSLEGNLRVIEHFFIEKPPHKR